MSEIAEIEVVSQGKFGGTLEAKLITRPEFGCTLWEATE
jgi:hypothetical protein